MIVTAATQAASGPSPAGLVVLAVILGVVAYLFLVGKEIGDTEVRVPSPVDIGRLGMSKLRGHPDETAGQDEDSAADADTDDEVPKRPEVHGTAWDDPNGILERPDHPPMPRPRSDRPPVRRHAPPASDSDDAADDGQDDDLEVEPSRTPRAERLQWLRDRQRRDDPIRARYRLKTDFYRAAADTLGVDEKTIRRDLAHLAKTRSARP